MKKYTKEELFKHVIVSQLELFNYPSNSIYIIFDKNDTRKLAMEYVIVPMLIELFEAGYETVYIGSCKHWKDQSHSIIGEPKISKDGRPVIWDIVKKHLGRSCGNGLSEADQYQGPLWIPDFIGTYKRDDYV